MDELAPIDVVLLVLGGIFILRGFVRGFIKEFFSLGAPVLGLLGSILLHKNGAAFLRANYFRDIKWIPEALAFIGIFLLVFILCKIVQKLISDIIEGLSLDAIDKVLGCIFGVVEALVAVSLVLFVISIQPVFDAAPLLQGSLIANKILPLVIDTSRETLKTLQGATAFLRRSIQIPG